MKYEIRTLLTVAKELKELKVDGLPNPTVTPVFDLVELPTDAVGLHAQIEVQVIVPVGTPKPFPGTEQAFMRKHTKAICHITYLVPKKEWEE
jgi:hypothetical protein